MKLPATWPSRQFMKLFESKTQGMGMSSFEFSWMGDSRFKGFRREKEPDECFFRHMISKLRDGRLVMNMRKFRNITLLIALDVVRW